MAKAAMRQRPTQGSINIGQPAPLFELQDDAGQPVRLSDFRGRKVVLYFYPKDNTPGCTREACDFREAMAEFKKKNAVVLGVSADSVASHQRFKQKFQLPFPLLSDPEKAVLRAYGVWKEKSFLGKRFMGIERTTVVIDESGRIARIFPKVRVEGHVEEVLAAL